MAVCLSAWLAQCILKHQTREANNRLWVQASKDDHEQPSIATVLPPLDAGTAAVDVCVVGCGPSGLALAAELGALGLNVGLIGDPRRSRARCSVSTKSTETRPLVREDSRRRLRTAAASMRSREGRCSA